MFHLKELEDNLVSLGIETKLIVDTEIYDGFPSKNPKKMVSNKK